MAALLLIRHAQSVRDASLAEELWPLGETGMAQAEALAETLSSYEIERIYSSPYIRAIDTVRPFAAMRGLEIELEHDLRERRISDGLIDDFHSVIERSWNDRNFKLPGCESAKECQHRVYSCIERLVSSTSDGLMVVSSHGNAISLFINKFDPSFGFDAWRAMKNPHIFELEWSNGRWSLTGH